MSNMKAAVLHAPWDLRIEDVKKPEISKANEVLVRHGNFVLEEITVSVKTTTLLGQDVKGLLQNMLWHLLS